MLRRVCCATATRRFVPASLGPFAATPHGQARWYVHDVPNDLVPEGESASAAGIGGNPKRRQKRLKEMCLSPVFGARIECCALGFHQSPGPQMLPLRKQLPALIAEAIGVDPSDVTLGLAQKYIKDTDAFNKSKIALDPAGRGIEHPAPRTIVPIHLPDHWDMERQLVLGHKLYATVMSVGKEGNTEASRRHRYVLSTKGGAMYATPPQLEPEALWDVVAGEPVDADEAADIAAAWDETLVRLATNGDIDDSFLEDRELEDLEVEAEALEAKMKGMA